MPDLLNELYEDEILVPTQTAKEKQEDKETGPTDQTKAEKDAARRCWVWFDHDKQAKDFYTEEMDELDKLFEGYHWDLIGPNGQVLRTAAQQSARPNAVENVAMAMIESLVAEFAEDQELIDIPREQNDHEAAEKLTDLKRYIAYKNRIRVERIEWLRHFFLYGTACWHVYWDPDWKGGKGPNRWRGEIRWEAMHPRNIFPDARCGADINSGRRVHKAVKVPLEEIRERFPEYGHLLGTDYINTDIFGDEPTGEDDSGTNEGAVLLVETWYIGRPLVLREAAEDEPAEEDQGIGLHVIWWAGEDQQIYLDHANYVYHEPGETPQFPFIVRQRYPRKHGGQNSIWGYGDAHFIKWPQVMLNKTDEMIMEGHMHSSIGQNLYQQGALSAEQEKRLKRYGTIPGQWFKVNNIDKIKRERGAGVPDSLQREPERLRKTMEGIIGRYDVSQGRTPGSVTAFRAMDLLEKRARVRLRSADESITTAFEDVGNQTNNLITQFYNERRSYRILGQDDPRQAQYGTFNLGEHKKVYLFETDTTLPLNEFEARKAAAEGEKQPVEGKDYEIYAPEMDTVCKTSTVLPSDRLFFMELAKELFVAQRITLEDFFYVLDKGRFPPIAELEQRMQDQQMAMQGAQQTAPGVQPGAAQVPQQAAPPRVAPQPPTIDPQEIIGQLDPDVQEQLAQLPSEAQDRAIAAILQQAGVF